MATPQEGNARGRGPTPSAYAMKAYLLGPGRLQIGSRFIPEAGRIWFRPLKGGKWYADKAHIVAGLLPLDVERPGKIVVRNPTIRL
jgi:hypothetical protein